MLWKTGQEDGLLGQSVLKWIVYPAAADADFLTELVQNEYILGILI